MKNLFLMALATLLFACNSQNEPVQYQRNDIAVADSILESVTKLYHVEKYNLLTETYPVNPDHKVGYLADNDNQIAQEVAYLWPYSGLMSGVVALYHHTKDAKYLDYIEKNLIPGLAQYWDDTRQPPCYQSYPAFNGHSDRFYDDNDWLALDFCNLYMLTKNDAYLKKSIELKEFIYSGWDDKLGGGIYWCEQKRTEKNTCANAPAAVLCAKLFKATNDSAYLKLAVETYEWTKKNLMDPADGVYWDNIKMDSAVDKAKYTYNSGQMIEAAVLLYQLTGNAQYLTDAQFTAKGAYNHFAKPVKIATGEARFYPDMPWFNVIMFRGLKALYQVDKNAEYIQTMYDNAYYAWENTRDENGLLGNNWAKQTDNKYKWLLDNDCMVELFAEFSDLDLK